MSLGYEGSTGLRHLLGNGVMIGRELQTTGRGTYVPWRLTPAKPSSSIGRKIGHHRNERTKLQVAHTKLSYSRAFIVRAYLLQTHEMLFPMPIIMHSGSSAASPAAESTTTCARRSIASAAEGDVNVRFLAMASHYVKLSRSSAIPRLVGRKGRSRRMFRMRVIASSNLFRAFHQVLVNGGGSRS